MRAIRALTVAALVALDVSVAAAQATRHFKDSWFWGLKGGITSYQVQSNPQAYAPLAGIDWLITRTNGGLYVSFDHSFFTRDSVFVNDSLSPLDTVPRTIILSGLRRFTVAGMLFPMQSYRLHPYVGFGASLSHIAKALPLGAYRNGTQQQLVEGTVQQFPARPRPSSSWAPNCDFCASRRSHKPRRRRRTTRSSCGQEAVGERRVRPESVSTWGLRSTR